MSTTHNITQMVKKNVVCSSSNRKLNFIKTCNNSKQNNQANQASLPSTSTKVASTIVSCDLQSPLWMLLYSGLPIAELTRTSLTNTWNRGTRGTEEHEEHEKHEEHEEHEDTGRSQNGINAMATPHTYKRGHTPRIQKGPKRPTLAWNEIQFVTQSLRDHRVFPQPVVT